MTATPPGRLEISREDLYEQVWTTPMNRLAESLGVSSFHLVHVCETLSVPRPPAGYWQKKAVGKDKPRPELPALMPGRQSMWSKDRQLAPPIRRVVQKKPVEKPGLAKSARIGRHPLLLGVEGYFRKTHKVEEGEFLRPYKQLLPDIVVSADSLVLALDLASEVYSALDKKGHRVGFAPTDQKMFRVSIEEREKPGKDRKYGRYGHGSIWSPHRPTITWINEVPIGLALTEMTERATMRYVGGKHVRETNATEKLASLGRLGHSWTHEQDLPCGRFRLVAYSPIHGVNWEQSWQEADNTRLRSTISDIVRGLESSEDQIRSLMISAEVEAERQRREWEAQQERWRREDDQRRVKEAQSESRKQLADIMDRWVAAATVGRFFREAETRVEALPEDRRARLIERLGLARSMLGAVDPLEFLEGWLAPDERYRSKYDQT